MSLRKSFLAELFYRILEWSLLPQMERLAITANQLTTLGLMAAVVVPLGFYVHPLLGMLLIILSGIADATDGYVARTRSMATAYGAFLDSCFDRISDFFYLLGFWVLFWHNEGLITASVLVFLSCLFSVMVSYIKARAQSVGVSCEVGMMERGWRTLYLIVWAFFIGISFRYPAARIILWLGLILFCGLTFITVIQRLLHIRAKLHP
ncbi:MAG: CDP-alcohol phosphatidyltransferase family protein [Thermodesulfobacteriota bacterium]